MIVSPLDALVFKRKKQHRNCIIIIADRNSETGTGKSTLALVLAQRYDSMFSPDNVVFDTMDFIKRMTEKRRRGAWYVLDEIGVYLDSRRAVSRGNVNFSQLLQVFREEQISLIATLPTTSVLDFRMKELSDIVILVNDRGSATVYRTGTNPFATQHPVYMNELMKISWSPLDGSVLWSAYRTKKRAFLNKKYSGLLAVKKVKEKRVTKKEKILKLLKKEKGMTPKEIAKKVGTEPAYVRDVRASKTG